MNQKRRNNPDNLNNNRINFLIAIVFLFGFSMVARLFYLQVVKHGLYITLANNQQQSENILLPERGRILLLDKDKSGGDIFYPLADNKQLALIYAIPKEIESKTEAENIANKVFVVFDLADEQAKIDEDFKKMDEADLSAQLAAAAALPEAEKKIREGEIRRQFNLLHVDKTWLAGREKKKDAALDSVKNSMVGAYLEVFSRKDSQYAPLEKKVDEETLKRFYSLFPARDGREIKFDNLFLRNGKVLERQSASSSVAIRPKGISHSMENYRYYPENNFASQLLGFVRSNNNILTGNYGLEGFFDKELAGTAGYLKTDVGARKTLAILNDQQYVKPKNGGDLVLTIDRSIQFYACQKLNEAAELHKADSASLVAVDPKTGAIIAMCSVPDFDPNNYQNEKNLGVFNNPVVFEQYEPGSVFKAITMAAAMNEGKVTPETTYEDKGSIIKKGWKKPIKNADFSTAGAHGIVDMTYVLEYSLNTGVIFALEKIGSRKFSEYVKGFGFGERTGIELESESAGNINNLLAKKINELDADTASFGQGISVTPLQMLMSFAAIANGGVLMKPFVVKELVAEDGTREETKPREIRSVISEKTANLLVGMLVSDVENGHSKKAQIAGYYVAGKTGTAQVPSKSGYGEETIHSFIGLAPADDPKFVILVKFNNPKDFPWADYTATPFFRDIADFMLKYYQVPKGR
jgi:cell division protein FtsI/penicillin-binding protein 2